MATGQDIVDWIMTHEGTRDNSGTFMWGLAGMPQFAGSPWCGATVVAAHKALGVDDTGWITDRQMIYTPDDVTQARRHGMWTHSVNARIGWPVLFDWQGHQDSNAQNADHIGTVVHNDPRLPYITAVGGNTSDGVHRGLERGVFLRRRPRTDIMGVVDISKLLTTHSVVPVAPEQKLVVDGVIGTRTTEALGAKDGIFSGQPKTIRDSRAVAQTLDACWPTLVYGHGGSKAIARLQKWSGAETDGFFGPGSRRALQRKLGVKQDGLPGYNTAKALQRAINDKKI